MTARSAIFYNAAVTVDPLPRVCPVCQTPTASAVCPKDGSRTVPASQEPPSAGASGSSSESKVGTVFGNRYRVDAVLGKGGMGTVYRARQLSVDRAVAIKILNPGLISNPEQVRRFHNEARAASLLEHPHTIRLYDFGETDTGSLYHVTELLEGEPLSALIARRGRIPLARTLAIAQQILRALAEAHAHGIVHRDLKPENIFLQAVHGEGDFIKVLDFGIAKMAPIGKDWRRLTQVGTVVGTPLYMSPEQARGLEVDPRSDLYSFGAVLFEMLVGFPPFMADTAVDIMLAHVQEPPPPLGLSDSARGRAVEALVLRLLAKQPSQRPDTAEAVRLEIAAALALPEDPDDDAPSKRDSRLTPLPIAPSRPPGAITIEAIRAATGGLPRVAAGAFAFVLLAAGLGTAIVMWAGRNEPDGPIERAARTVTAPAPTPPPAPPPSPAPAALAPPAPLVPSITSGAATRIARRDPEPDTRPGSRAPIERNAVATELPAAEKPEAVRRPKPRVIKPHRPLDKPVLKVDKK